MEALLATSKWDEHVSMLPYSLALLATLSVVPVPIAPNFAPLSAPLCCKPDLGICVYCGSLQEAVANIVNESHACASKVAIMSAQIPGRAQQLERMFGDAPECNVKEVMQSLVDRLTEEAIIANESVLQLLKAMRKAQSPHKTVQEEASARRAELLNMSDFKGKDRDALSVLLRRTQQVLGPYELKDKWAGLVAFFETLETVISVRLSSATWACLAELQACDLPHGKMSETLMELDMMILLVKRIKTVLGDDELKKKCSAVIRYFKMLEMIAKALVERSKGMSVVMTNDFADQDVLAAARQG
ncbi:hypothetical protein GGF31_003874 [Allomyces arbusculus]|nr:hypothetical protein GGF31_003874 [Allomyces arbusculus]